MNRRCPDSLPFAAALGLLLGLAGCGPVAVEEALAGWPDASDARPSAGCRIVSVDEAVPLPRGPGGPGEQGPRRAMLRHTADCLPIAPGARETYRIQFVQEFTERQGKPGPGARWNGTSARVDDTLPPARRTVDVASEGLGKNCVALLARIEGETLRCVRAMDASVAGQLEQAMGQFRSQNQFPMNVNDDNHLQAVRLGRDARCLEYWHQMQRQMETRFADCWAN